MADMTFDQVREDLAVSKGHLRNLIAASEIPYYRVGRLIRFEPGKIAAWKASGGTSARTPQPSQEAGPDSANSFAEVGPSSAWRRSS